MGNVAMFKAWLFVFYCITYKLYYIMKKNKSKKDTAPVTTTINETEENYDTLRNEILDEFLLKYGVNDDEDEGAPREELDEDAATREEDANDDDVFSEEDFERLLDDFIRSEHASSDGTCSDRGFLGEEESDEGGDGCGDAEAGASGNEDKGNGVSDSELVCENMDEALGLHEPLLTSMDFLVGLDGVKSKLAEYEKVVRFNQWRFNQKLPSMPMPLHAMFLGSPGTGKTTVAKLMGVMLKRAGVLSKGHVVMRERAELMGNCYGDQETKTLEAMRDAEGGILFIDEAYQLYHPEDPRDPGKFVIDTLLTAMADESRDDWMLILAGYPDEMRRMFEMNPGLASRIPESNIYDFEDLDEGQLMQVAERYLGRYEYTLSHDARIALASRIASDYAARTRSFGNARYVHNLIQTDILPSMATRVVDSGEADMETLTTILPADIPAPVRAIPQGRRPIGFVA